MGKCILLFFSLKGGDNMANVKIVLSAEQIDAIQRSLERGNRVEIAASKECVRIWESHRLDIKPRATT